MQQSKRFQSWAGICLLGVLWGTAAFATDRDEISDFYEDAQKQFNKGEYDAAIIQLKNVLQLDPKNLPALVLLGQSYIENGDGPSAETALNEATAAGADISLTAAPRGEALILQFRHQELLTEPIPEELPHTKRAELLEVKAKAAMQLNDRKSLRKILKDIQNLHVNSAGELAIRAALAMREGKLDDARRLIDTAVAAAPNSPLTWLSRASLSHLDDDHSAALAEYAEVIRLEPSNVAARLARIGLLLDLDRAAETEADLDFLKKRESKDPRLLFLQALKAQREDEPKKARVFLDEAAKLTEILGSVLVKGNLQLLMIAGISNYYIGNMELAEGYLTDYVKFAHGETQTRRMLATLLMRKKEFANAIRVLTKTLEQEGDSAEVLALLAKAYTADGQHQRATEALERATTLRPGDATLQTNLAVSRAMKGQSEAALASLSAVFEDDKSRETAGMPLAILRMSRGDYQGAEAVAARLLETEAGNITYLNLHGVTLVGLGRFDEARIRFEKALSLNEKYKPALLNLAKLDRRTANYESARKRLDALRKLAPSDNQVLLELARVRQAQGEPKAALKLARAAYKAAPDSIEIAEELASLLIAGKDFEGARNVIFEQENKHPDHLQVLSLKSRLLTAAGKLDDLRPLLKHMSEVAEFNVDWLVPIGEQQIRLGLLADAQYTMFKALQERPRDVPLRARVGDLELALGNIDAALARARGLTGDFPDHPAGYALLGDIATAQRRFTEAADFYAQARQRPGGSRPEIVLKHHEALAAAQDSSAAEQVLIEWVGRNPGHTWATLRLAEYAMSLGRYDVARTRFETLLAQDPNHAEALNNLANTLIWLGNFPEAEVRARAALKQAPDNPYVNDTLGWALVRANRAKEGLPFLREARTRASNVPEIRYHLAYALHELGRPGEARKELQSALTAGVEFTERADALKLQAALGAR